MHLYICPDCGYYGTDLVDGHIQFSGCEPQGHGTPVYSEVFTADKLKLKGKLSGNGTVERARPDSESVSE